MRILILGIGFSGLSAVVGASTVPLDPSGEARFLVHSVDLSGGWARNYAFTQNEAFRDWCLEESQCTQALDYIVDSESRKAIKTYGSPPGSHIGIDTVKLGESIGKASNIAAARVLVRIQEIMEANGFTAHFGTIDETVALLSKMSEGRQITDHGKLLGHIHAPEDDVAFAIVQDSQDSDVQTSVDEHPSRATSQPERAPKSSWNSSRAFNHTLEPNITHQHTTAQQLWSQEQSFLPPAAAIGFVETVLREHRCVGDPYICNYRSDRLRPILAFFRALTADHVLARHNWLRLVLDQMMQEPGTRCSSPWDHAEQKFGESFQAILKKEELHDKRKHEAAYKKVVKAIKHESMIQARTANELNPVDKYFSESFNPGTGRLETMTLLLDDDHKLDPAFEGLGYRRFTQLRSDGSVAAGISCIRRSGDLHSLTAGKWGIEPISRKKEVAKDDMARLANPVFLDLAILGPVAGHTAKSGSRPAGGAEADAETAATIDEGTKEPPKGILKDPTEQFPPGMKDQGTQTDLSGNDGTGTTTGVQSQQDKTKGAAKDQDRPKQKPGHSDAGTDAGVQPQEEGVQLEQSPDLLEPFEPTERRPVKGKVRPEGPKIDPSTDAETRANTLSNWRDNSIPAYKDQGTQTDDVLPMDTGADSKPPEAPKPDMPKAPGEPGGYRTIAGPLPKPLDIAQDSTGEPPQPVPEDDIAPANDAPTGEFAASAHEATSEVGSGRDTLQGHSDGDVVNVAAIPEGSVPQAASEAESVADAGAKAGGHWTTSPDGLRKLWVSDTKSDLSGIDSLLNKPKPNKPGSLAQQPDTLGPRLPKTGSKWPTEPERRLATIKEASAPSEHVDSPVLAKRAPRIHKSLRDLDGTYELDSFHQPLLREGPVAGDPIAMSSIESVPLEGGEMGLHFEGVISATSAGAVTFSAEEGFGVPVIDGQIHRLIERTTDMIRQGQTALDATYTAGSEVADTEFDHPIRWPDAKTQVDAMPQKLDSLTQEIQAEIRFQQSAKLAPGRVKEILNFKKLNGGPGDAAFEEALSSEALSGGFDALMSGGLGPAEAGEGSAAAVRDGVVLQSEIAEGMEAGTEAAIVGAEAGAEVGAAAGAAAAVGGVVGVLGTIGEAAAPVMLALMVAMDFVGDNMCPKVKRTEMWSEKAMAVQTPISPCWFKDDKLASKASSQSAQIATDMAAMSTSFAASPTFVVLTKKDMASGSTSETKTASETTVSVQTATPDTEPCPSRTLSAGFQLTAIADSRCPVPTPYECTDDWFHRYVNKLPAEVRNPSYCWTGELTGHDEAMDMGCLPAFKKSECRRKFIAPVRKNVLASEKAAAKAEKKREAVRHEQMVKQWAKIDADWKSLEAENVATAAA